MIFRVKNLYKASVHQFAFMFIKLVKKISFLLILLIKLKYVEMMI